MRMRMHCPCASCFGLPQTTQPTWWAQHHQHTIRASSCSCAFRIPFNGMPSDFERFERDFSTRLSREYLVPEGR
eukprot:scaffold6299_cov109-Isochrysis_galbana.AAC.6